MVLSLGLPVIGLLVGGVWFTCSSYRRSAIAERSVAEQCVAELDAETKALLREVAVTDLMVADVRRLIHKPAPLDKGMIDGLAAMERAELAKQARDRKNQEVNVGLRSVKQQIALFGSQSYLLKSAIESGKIQFMVIPQNGNVSVPTPSATTSR
jgi:hypothetical protein